MLNKNKLNSRIIDWENHARHWEYDITDNAETLRLTIEVVDITISLILLKTAKNKNDDKNGDKPSFWHILSLSQLI